MPRLARGAHFADGLISVTHPEPVARLRSCGLGLHALIAARLAGADRAVMIVAPVTLLSAHLRAATTAIAIEGRGIIFPLPPSSPLSAPTRRTTGFGVPVRVALIGR